MMWVMVVMVLLSSFLLFYSLFQVFFVSDKRIETRMSRYLQVSEKKKLKMDPKQFNLFIQLQISKDKLQEKLNKKDTGKKIEVMLDQSGLNVSPAEFILFRWIITAITGGLLFLLSNQIVILIFGCIVGYILPKLWVNRKQKQRLTRFNAGLADMITTIIGSLRAGFSFPQALKTVVEEAEEPIKDEVEIVLREMQYGKSLEEALNDLKERMPSEDLVLMIQAILIQKQVGGNLATVLDKIVQTIRDRTRIQGQIATLTAQGKLSGVVIGLLPIVLGFVLYLIQPDYIGTLFTNPIGLLMVGGGAVSGVIGFILVRKITNIEV